jgi:HK97 family phage prohead protease
MLDPERFAEWRRTHPPIMGADDGTVPVNGRSPIARAMTGGVLLRADNEDGDNPDDGRTLFGHFSVFNRWTEIDSWIEGHFMERIAPGAFKKTFREKTPKVLFQHGMDPQIADQPIASVRELREDDEGAYFEARLLDGLDRSSSLEGLRARRVRHRRSGSASCVRNGSMTRTRVGREPEGAAVSGRSRRCGSAEFGPGHVPGISEDADRRRSGR